MTFWLSIDRWLSIAVSYSDIEDAPWQIHRRFISQTWRIYQKQQFKALGVNILKWGLSCGDWNKLGCSTGGYNGLPFLATSELIWFKCRYIFTWGQKCTGWPTKMLFIFLLAMQCVVNVFLKICTYIFKSLYFITNMRVNMCVHAIIRTWSQNIFTHNNIVLQAICNCAEIVAQVVCIAVYVISILKFVYRDTYFAQTGFAIMWSCLQFLGTLDGEFFIAVLADKAIDMVPFT